MTQAQMEIANFILDMCALLVPACVVVSVVSLLVRVFRRFLNG